MTDWAATQTPSTPTGICRPSSKMTCMLKPGGLLFLSFPVATVDRLWWNVHRVYGPLRIPFVLRHFHLVEVFGDIASDDSV